MPTFDPTTSPVSLGGGGFDFSRATEFLLGAAETTAIKEGERDADVKAAEIATKPDTIFERTDLLSEDSGVRADAYNKRFTAHLNDIAISAVTSKAELSVTSVTNQLEALPLGGSVEVDGKPMAVDSRFYDLSQGLMAQFDSFTKRVTESSLPPPVKIDVHNSLRERRAAAEASISKAKADRSRALLLKQHGNDVQELLARPYNGDPTSNNDFLEQANRLERMSTNLSGAANFDKFAAIQNRKMSIGRWYSETAAPEQMNLARAGLGRGPYPSVKENQVLEKLVTDHNREMGKFGATPFEIKRGEELIRGAVLVDNFNHQIQIALSRAEQETYIKAYENRIAAGGVQVYGAGLAKLQAAIDAAKENLLRPESDDTARNAEVKLIVDGLLEELPLKDPGAGPMSAENQDAHLKDEYRKFKGLVDEKTKGDPDMKQRVQGLLRARIQQTLWGTKREFGATESELKKARAFVNEMLHSLPLTDPGAGPLTPELTDQFRKRSFGKYKEKIAELRRTDPDRAQQVTSILHTRISQALYGTEKSFKQDSPSVIKATEIMREVGPPTKPPHSPMNEQERDAYRKREFNKYRTHYRLSDDPKMLQDVNAFILRAIDQRLAGTTRPFETSFKDRVDAAAKPYIDQIEFNPTDVDGNPLTGEALKEHIRTEFDRVTVGGVGAQQTYLDPHGVLTGAITLAEDDFGGDKELRWGVLRKIAGGFKSEEVLQILIESGEEEGKSSAMLAADRKVKVSESVNGMLKENVNSETPLEAAPQFPPVSDDYHKALGKNVRNSSAKLAGEKLGFAKYLFAAQQGADVLSETPGKAAKGEWFETGALNLVSLTARNSARAWTNKNEDILPFIRKDSRQVLRDAGIVFDVSQSTDDYKLKVDAEFSDEIEKPITRDRIQEIGAAVLSASKMSSSDAQSVLEAIAGSKVEVALRGGVTGTLRDELYGSKDSLSRNVRRAAALLHYDPPLMSADERKLHGRQQFERSFSEQWDKLIGGQFRGFFGGYVPWANYGDETQAGHYREVWKAAAAIEMGAGISGVAPTDEDINEFMPEFMKEHKGDFLAPDGTFIDIDSGILKQVKFNDENAPVEAVVIRPDGEKEPLEGAMLADLEASVNGGIEGVRSGDRQLRIFSKSGETHFFLDAFDFPTGNRIGRIYIVRKRQ